MNMIKTSKIIPENRPDVEWKVIHTNGMSPEVPDWLKETFGEEWNRWFIINRDIYIREDKDYNWFILRWMSC